MKRQMLNRRGDLLASQVWKNIVGFVTDDKGFKVAMEALHISLPVMTMELMKYQPMPKLEWDRGRRQDASQDRKARQSRLSAKKKGRPYVREGRPKGFRI